MRAYAVLCVVLTVAVFLCPIAALGAEKEENEQVENSYAIPNGAEQNAEEYISVMSPSTGQTEKIKLREYVIGAVAAEMSPLYHTQALKAQAVACYTYAKRQTENRLLFCYFFTRFFQCFCVFLFEYSLRF